MGITIGCQEYFDLHYKATFLEKKVEHLLEIIKEKDDVIANQTKELKELNELLDKVFKSISTEKTYAVSVSPDGDIAFSDDFVKDDIRKSVIKDIITSDTLQGLYEKTEQLQAEFTSTMDAIKRQDGVVVERSLEADAELQLERIREIYTNMFIEDLKQNDSNKCKEILTAVAKELSDKITLPNTPEYRGIGDPLFEEYSKYKYTLKDGNPEKVYKVVGIRYVGNSKDKTVKSVLIKLVNTVLSGEEIVVKPEQLIRDQFCHKVNVQTKNGRKLNRS